jgi:hypothetical protein
VPVDVLLRVHHHGSWGGGGWLRGFGFCVRRISFLRRGFAMLGSEAGRKGEDGGQGGRFL